MPVHHSFVLTVKHRVPSLNRLFAMNHWQRHREKKETQLAVQCALKATEPGSAIPTIWLENTSSMPCAMKEFFKTIRLRLLTIQCANTKSPKRKMSEQ